MIAALVPVKRLDAAKSRLRSVLGAAEIEGLALAMLGDVLEALLAVPALGRVVVVTPDREVAKAALEAGAEAALRADPGLNPSLDAAARELADAGARALLVVLGDVPGVEPGDVRALLEALEELGGRGVVLAPCEDGGSAALLRAPHDVIPSCFGPGSAERHRAAARAAGVPLRELPLPGLAIDLDRPEDVEAFLGRTSGGRRTRALLRALRTH
jgi:2-phospho-L-lactate guanylyltransferase